MAADQDPVAALKSAQERLARRILAAHRQIWPQGVNGTYTVTDYQGAAKVEFSMPAVKEAGYRD